MERVCRLLWEKKAQDIRVLDVRPLTTLTDRMVLATGASRVHVRALTEELLGELRKRRARALSVEGREEGLWVVLDLGSIIVHLFEPDTREFYGLERLWADAPQHVYPEEEEGTPGYA